MSDGYFSITDPFSFSATFLSVGTLFPTGPSITGQPATGKLWVSLPRSTYAKVQGGRKLVINQKLLSKQDGQNFARFFKAQTNAAQIPWIFGPASLIPIVGAVITIATSTIDGLQRLSEPPINSDQLSVLMAEGGSFIRTIAEETSSRLTLSVLYTVKVGNEVRVYGGVFGYLWFEHRITGPQRTPRMARHLPVFIVRLLWLQPSCLFYWLVLRRRARA
jgi:hypothetical protein